MTGGQVDLFGNPVVPLAEQRQRRAESNDVDLMHTVAGNAVRCGYVLVGNAERVYARVGDTDGQVQRVPRWEEDAVHQLLRRRWLTTGAEQWVVCGAATLSGAVVLVPKATRDQVTRWARQQHPPSPTSPPRSRPRSTCAACKGTGRIPNSRQAIWTPERGVHRPDTTSPCHWCGPGARDHNKENR